MSTAGPRRPAASSLTVAAALAAVAALALGLTACPRSVPPAPPPTPVGGGWTPPAPPPPPAIDAAPAPRAVGAACMSAGDCDSGVCEGEGCGADAPGRCVAAGRMCTMDVVSYCGCDGKTLAASGSCPGMRYAHRGGCQPETPAPPPPPPAKKPAGEACLGADDCESGVCAGEGCSDDKPGRCVAATQKCTRDARPYCGCDGASFFGSGTCPGKRFAHRGKC